MKRYVGIVCGLLCLMSIAQAQEKTSPFWGKQEAYLTNQTIKSLELVNQLLAENPPSANERAGDAHPRGEDHRAFLPGTEWSAKRADFTWATRCAQTDWPVRCADDQLLGQ